MTTKNDKPIHFKPLHKALPSVAGTVFTLTYRSSYGWKEQDSIAVKAWCGSMNNLCNLIPFLQNQIIALNTRDL